ncbi:SUMO-specific isopeptidase USPL1-like [Ptychodera flava]|uniref:SUMO-specific isopeptidase USPL1-like n=1 Tax=Ptychodera flava TaxID=63121 RepID=UPI00396A01FB
MDYGVKELQWCPRCEKDGVKRRLKLSQINLTEALWICDNVQCPYPFGADCVSSVVVKRNVSEIGSKRKRKRTLGDDGENRKFRQSEASSVSDVSSVITSAELDELLDMLNGVEGNESTSETSQEKSSSAKKSQTNSGLKTKRRNEVAFERTANFVKSLSQQPCVQTGEEDVSSQNDVNTPKYKEPFKRKVFVGYTLGANTGSCGSQGRFSERETDLQKGDADSSPLTVPAEEKSLTIQWQNDEALCWLDAVLCLLVHCKSLQSRLKHLMGANKSVIKDLCHVYDRAKTSVFGKGNNGLDLSKLDDAMQRLTDVRHKLFTHLEPRLKCELGKYDSPVLALPLLLKEDAGIEECFQLKYHWKFSCSECGFEKLDRFEKLLPTLPNVGADINMPSPYFVRPCYRCNTDRQKSVLNFDSVSDCVMLHFLQGLPTNDVDRYEFTQNGYRFRVSAMVQYLENPKHFITWCRDDKDNWLKCDDLESSVVQWHRDAPTFPGSEIHIVLWEKQATNVKGHDTSKAVPSVSSTENADIQQSSSVNFVNEGTSQVSSRISDLNNEPLGASQDLTLVSSTEDTVTISGSNTASLKEYKTTNHRSSIGMFVSPTKLNSNDLTFEVQTSSSTVVSAVDNNLAVEMTTLVDTPCDNATFLEKTAPLSHYEQTLTAAFSNDSIIIRSGNTGTERKRVKRNIKEACTSSDSSHRDLLNTAITTYFSKNSKYTAKKTTTISTVYQAKTSKMCDKATSVISKIPSTMLNTRQPCSTLPMDNQRKTFKSPFTIDKQSSTMDVTSDSRRNSLHTVGRSSHRPTGPNKFASYGSRPFQVGKLGSKKQFSGYNAIRKQTVPAIAEQNNHSSRKANYAYMGISQHNSTVVPDYNSDSWPQRESSMYRKRPSSVSYSDQSSPSSISSASSLSSRDDLFSSVHDELCKALDVASDCDSSCVSSRVASPIDDDFFKNLISDDTSENDKLMEEVMSELSDIVSETT